MNAIVSIESTSLAPVANEMLQKWKLAQKIASSKMIPVSFQNKPEDVFVAMEMAESLNTSVFIIMPNLHLIQGKPSFSSVFIQSMLNKSKLIKGRLHFEFTGTGNDLVCTAWAIDRETEERLEAKVSMAMAIAEGWATKAGNKYKTMPEQMLSYRATSMFVRRYYSDVMLGFSTVEEASSLPAPVTEEEVIDFSTPPPDDDIDFSDVTPTPIVDEHEFPVQPTIFKEIN